MRSVLLSMGFGPSFVQWVNLIYSKVQSCVNVNGYLSSFFSLSRGVRQGCPLSPLLYVLVSEVLAVNIRANPRIVGLSLPGVPAPLSPISQYADDTSIVITSDDSIHAVFKTFSLFERGSGAKLNQSKCKGLWISSWRGRQDPPWLWNGPRRSSKCLVFLLVLVTLRVLTGGPALMRLPTFWHPGGSARYPMGDVRWWLTPWRRLVFGMWLLWRLSLTGFMQRSLS